MIKLVSSDALKIFFTYVFEISEEEWDNCIQDIRITHHTVEIEEIVRDDNKKLICNRNGDMAVRHTTIPIVGL